MSFQKDTTSSPLKPARNNFKILLIDDEEEKYIKSLQDALPAERFKVVGAANRKEVEDRLKESPLPAVIVIDAYFPDYGRILGGYIIAQFIRKNRELLNTPIVAYSNFAYHIEHGGTTEEEFERVRNKLETVGVGKFIDKNVDETGEINFDQLQALASWIERAVSKLEGNS